MPAGFGTLCTDEPLLATLLDRLDPDLELACTRGFIERWRRLGSRSWCAAETVPAGATLEGVLRVESSLFCWLAPVARKQLELAASKRMG